MTDPFELISQLGRGGMGVVWKARDVATGEIVAVKLLHALFADDADYVARFEREVEIGRRIVSPHVVQVLGFGRRDGVPYLTMEYVDGESLKELVKARGRLSWDEARPILRQVADGLQAAHDAGVIHRDMKPSNILIAPDGTAKVADFGIAKAADMTALTGSATMLGTPSYMAPEATTTVASDWYAFGCIAYEMLAGTPPFTGDTMQQVLMKHMRDDPDLSKLPVQARAVVAALLDKDPERRMGQLAKSAETLAEPRIAASAPTTPSAKQPSVWNVIRSLRGDSRVTAIAFASVEPLVAAGFKDGRVVAWRWTDAMPTLNARHGDTWITELEFHPNGGLLVSVNAVGSWATHELGAHYWTEHPADGVTHVVFDRTGSQAAMLRADGSVGLAHVDLRQRLARSDFAITPVRPYDSFVAAVAKFSPSGKQLALGGLRGRVARIDVSRNQIAHMLNAPVAGNVRHLTYVDDTCVRWVAGPIAWDWPTALESSARVIRQGLGSNQTSAISPDGRWFAHTSGMSVLVDELATKGQDGRPSLAGLNINPTQMPAALAFSVDSLLLAVGYISGLVEIFRRSDRA